MTADRYAEVFASAGLVVLLYDHRNFGASQRQRLPSRRS
jgi:alpha-beta hydrolase superfamily lysophospholipase